MKDIGFWYFYRREGVSTTWRRLTVQYTPSVLCVSDDVFDVVGT